MKINEIEQTELQLKCVDLISKTFLELGQTKTDKEIVILSQCLAEDLKEDFGKLIFEDIQMAFKNGVRRTDDFHLSVKTYYKWIKTHRQLIWDNDYKEPEHRDKRLKYRSRTGTGITTIQQKLIK
tara:strand:- start:371 stop:745 length:375 start_codon:yes stop_codon:yes gene_type:complete